MSGYYTLDVQDIIKQIGNNTITPFPHQVRAFESLSKTFTLPVNDYKGKLLVLPTGGGKTFTSINWICRHIINKNIKVLWMAQSTYLLDQATDTFKREIHNAVNRQSVNMRVVSSSTSHSNSGSILPTDDIVICTTQTAILSYSSKQLDGKGKSAKTPFREFIENCKELFIVVDEAHHTPAYGCRTLLQSIRDNISNVYILGLTATPMHNDRRISGWLEKIYDQPRYEVDKSELQAQKILAISKYIEKDTGEQFEVDDNLFDHLVNKHKDLPESIIDNLANNQNRNNFIISDYLNNKAEYGKTLIFADRWFQCDYIVEKLKENDIKANAVYSVVTGQDQDFKGGSGHRNNKENEEIMQDFRDGKYDVIVNVKMLTEGVDVPDVKTVMITRQTTSPILLTQMIGRALRGEKAGGGEDKDYANIVFFHDTWKRILPWANIKGDAEDLQTPKQGKNPYELVSIQLVKLLTDDIEYKGFENAPFITFIPVGFFKCEYATVIEDTDTISVEESIVVYGFNKGKYDKMIQYALTLDLSHYENENTTESQLKDKARELLNTFFDDEMDDFDNILLENVTIIMHHIAQNKEKPLYIDFKERDLYDMDRLAESLIDTTPREARIILENEYNDQNKLWSFFYKKFEYFRDAFNKAQDRILDGVTTIKTPNITPIATQDIVLTKEIKEQIINRDNNTCLCCGRKSEKWDIKKHLSVKDGIQRPKPKKIPLEVDHIKPVRMGGTNAFSNLQTLCDYCNSPAVKSSDTIDFRENTSPLYSSKRVLKTYDPLKDERVDSSIRRIINMFYHCSAVYSINYHPRKNGQFYYTWEIVLYAGNDPTWLEHFVQELLEYIKNHYEHVKHINIRN